MITLFMIVAAFAGTALAKGFIKCSFSDTALPQCYGAEGKQLIFQFSEANMNEIRLTKDDKYMILSIGKNETVTLNEDYVSKFEKIQPGTFRLGNAMKKHSGDYRLDEYRTDGQKLRTAQVHLKIQESVSKPAVSQRCFSLEEKTVTCSSNGDDVKFFLTLDGHSLNQNRDQGESNSNCKGEKSIVFNVCINIHGQLTGNLMCRACNNVSSEDSVIHLTACKGSESIIVPVLAVSTAALFLVLGLILIKLCKKRQPMQANEENADKGIIYADVKVKKIQEELYQPSNEMQNDFCS